MSGTYAAYVWAAYGVSAVAVLALVGVVWWLYRRANRKPR